MFRSLVDEAGAVWADDVHELLELAKTIATRRTAAPRAAAAGGLAIMTCSGGDSAQGADEAQRLGLELPALAPETATRLAAVLPSAATVANPLDYTAMIWGDVPALAELVRALGEDPAIGQVLVFYDQPHGLTGAPEESWRAVREGVMLGREPQPGAGDGVLDAARTARRRRRRRVRRGRGAGGGRAAHRPALRRRAPRGRGR